MPIQLRRFIACALAVGCGTTPSSRTPVKSPAVALSASRTTVQSLDSVTFIARVRADVAAQLRPTNSPGDPTEATPHIVGWHWIPDIDIIDPWTKACDSRDYTCAVQVHGSGTMVFSIRLPEQVCAGWIHIDALNAPGIDEANESDARARVRADSVSVAIRTKTPHWERCTA
jgi:hypothetical protein